MIKKTTRTRAPKRAGEERRRLILESAQTVFANSNYEKVGTADLAKAAGISEPALYRYFSGKKDLYRSTLKAAGARLLEIWRQVGRASENPLDALWTLGLGYYDHLQNRSPVLKLFFEALSETRDPDIRATVRENFRGRVDFVEKSLEEGRARGLVRAGVDLARWAGVVTGGMGVTVPPHAGFTFLRVAFLHTKLGRRPYLDADLGGARQDDGRQP